MIHEFQPTEVNTWFPPEYQQRYIKHLTGKSGLTDSQLQHFVRLWGYGYLKQHGFAQSPILNLKRKIEPFMCSHSEACDLFYADVTKGTPKAAADMMKTFVAKRLITREVIAGTATRITLCIPPEFDLAPANQPEQTYVDSFNPRTDTPIVVQFVEELFSHDGEHPDDLQYNIHHGFRSLAQRYPVGLKVLRCAKTKEPIGFVAVVPVHPKSSRKFYQQPKKSRFLARFGPGHKDPIEIATPGDPDCYIAYIRSWQIKPGMWNHENAFKLLEATKAILREMFKEYPNLSDIYSINIHPRLEDFAFNLGFKPMKQDVDTTQRWIYMALDHFLVIDSEDVLLNFDWQRWNRL